MRFDVLLLYLSFVGVPLFTAANSPNSRRAVPLPNCLFITNLFAKYPMPAVAAVRIYCLQGLLFFCVGVIVFFKGVKTHCVLTFILFALPFGATSSI